MRKSLVKVTALLVFIFLLGYWFWMTDRNMSFIQAVRFGDLGTVRAGLDSGIDPNRASMKGATALKFAVDSNRPGHGDIVRLLVDHGADPNDGVSVKSFL